MTEKHYPDIFYPIKSESNINLIKKRNPKGLPITRYYQKSYYNPLIYKGFSYFTQHIVQHKYNFSK